MSEPRVLVADDEKGMRDFLSILLRKEGYAVKVAATGREALALAANEEFDLLITDIRMPELSGIELLERVRTVAPELLVVLITAYASTQTAIAALKLGAYDYLTKPFDVEELKIVVQKALERRHLLAENASLRRELRSKSGHREVIGQSDAIQRVMELIHRVADTTATVLLTGERGTGKEILARALHEASPRADEPFVSLNCAAIQESLLESELFGHVRGAFTGAVARHEGLFESAAGGTILLDEIGEMSTNMQAKLLRVLQERAVRRVGGNEEVKIDVRVVASTNRDLLKSVEDGSFRADLFDRLNVIGIDVPPLRARREDIPLLVDHFIRGVSEEMGRDIRGLEPEALRLLEAYDWPGNIRELENVIRRAVALESEELIRPQSLPDTLWNGESGGRRLIPERAEFALDEHLDALRRRFIEEALERSQGKMVDAAKLLGMTFRALRYYAKKYELR